MERDGIYHYLLHKKGILRIYLTGSGVSKEVRGVSMLTFFKLDLSL
jgi:hypothetical protein